VSVAFGGSESRTNSTARVNNNTANDQAVVFAPNSGANASRQQNPVNVRGHGSLTITNGLNAEQVADAIAQLGNTITSKVSGSAGTPTGDSGYDQALLLSLEDRLKATEARAEDEIKTSSPATVNKWLLWGGGIVLAAVVGFVLIKLFRKGK